MRNRRHSSPKISFSILLETSIKKMLIVEDEPKVSEFLRTVFSIFVDYRTTWTDNGAEALRFTRIDAPDIILLDINLPDTNGYKVCQTLKADPATTNTKVIMISGMTQTSDRNRAYEAGADLYLAKPFTATALLEKVEEMLGRE